MSNEWFERDERPPVGTVCEISHEGIHGQWKKAEILKYHENGSIAAISIDSHDFCGRGELGWIGTGSPVKFRPIKSDREKAIEEMNEIWMGQLGLYAKEGSTAHIVFGKIYDAGYRKVEDK